MEAVEGGAATARPDLGSDRRGYRDSIRVVVKGGNVQIGTDLFYGRIHHTGGPIRATYRRRPRGRQRAVPRLPRVGTLAPSASSASRLAKAALRQKRLRARHKARQVRLPARRFLGVDKKDRRRTMKILMAELERAVK